MKEFNIVLLPGTLCDERIFQFITPYLKNVYLVNLRNSDSVEEMLELIHEAPYEKFILIGFSMGGHIAQEFTLKYPEKVQKLIVIASSGEGYPEEEKKIVLDSLPMIEAGKFTGISDRRLKSYLSKTSYQNIEIKNLIHDMAGSDAKEVYLRQIKATLNRKNLSDQLNTINCPTIYIGGAEDLIVSKESIERTAKLVQNAVLKVLEDCGHFVPIEKPHVINLILSEFLE